MRILECPAWYLTGKQTDTHALAASGLLFAESFHASGMAPAPESKYPEGGAAVKFRRNSDSQPNRESLFRAKAKRTALPLWYMHKFPATLYYLRGVRWLRVIRCRVGFTLCRFLSHGALTSASNVSSHRVYATELWSNEFLEQISTVLVPLGHI